MAYVLRKVMLAKWIHDPEIGQLSDSELLIALEDLPLHDNRLSVFVVDDDKSNVEQIVAALAANNTRSPDDVEFFLLDVKELDALGIHWEKSLANTADKAVNSAHRDLVIVSKDKLENLAQAFVCNGKVGVILEKEVIRLIKQGIELGEIDRDEVKIVPHSRFWKN